MLLERVKVRGFRNIENEEVFFSPGVNFIYGKNAEGKTNLLEAVYYFSRGKSFRGATDRELCSFGRSGFEISADFLGGGRRKTLLYRTEGRDKVRLYNGAPVDRASEMIGHFRAVLFHPEHLLLVKGSPEGRREFLNVAIAGNDPSYLSLYATYAKILEERNSLLKLAHKGGPFIEDEFCVWSERLAAAAASITARRYEYVRRLSFAAADILTSLSAGRETLTVGYQSEVLENSIPILSEIYANLYKNEVRREIAAGFTVHGPHHDDLSLTLSGHAAREFASQGQQRSITLALKLAEGEVSRELTGEYPVFLFDDVMSELDPARRQFLLSSLEGRQILVTACDERDLSAAGVHRIATRGGHYEAVVE